MSSTAGDVSESEEVQPLEWTYTGLGQHTMLPPHFATTTDRHWAQSNAFTLSQCASKNCISSASSRSCYPSSPDTADASATSSLKYELPISSYGAPSNAFSLSKDQHFSFFPTTFQAPRRLVFPLYCIPCRRGTRSGVSQPTGQPEFRTRFVRIPNSWWPLRSRWRRTKGCRAQLRSSRWLVRGYQNGGRRSGWITLQRVF